MEKKQLPDTPWHLNYVFKEEDDPRRHKARCIYYSAGTCRCIRSSCYKTKCFGSSHCSEYAESYKKYAKHRTEDRTADEIEQDNINKYIYSLKPKKKQLIKSQNKYLYFSSEKLRFCLVCNDKLLTIEKSLRKCSFCGMYYVNEEDLKDPKVQEIIEAEDVLIMGNKIKDTPSSTNKIFITMKCKFQKKKSICSNKKSQFHNQRCNKDKCKYSKKIMINKNMLSH